MRLFWKKSKRDVLRFWGFDVFLKKGLYFVVNDEMIEMIDMIEWYDNDFEKNLNSNFSFFELKIIHERMKWEWILTC